MRKWSVTQRAVRRFYPWPLMEVGDYFIAEYRSGRPHSEEQNYLVRRACLVRSQTGKRFRTRKLTIGVKVERIS